MNKKLSIITVNLNNKDGLIKTIDSVKSLFYNNYEHIIIDGGSNDGSVEIIKEYHKINKDLKWVSESDKGIFNAMNKGVLKAKGEYCLFLNSGDWLIEKDIINKVFQQINNEDIIYCDILTDKNEKWIYPNHLSILYFYSNCIGHPSTFHKRELFDNIGLYDESLKITADYDFFIKAIVKNKATYKHIPILLTCFNTDGISLTQVDLKELEKNEILKNNFEDDYDDILRYRELLKEYQYYKSSRLIQFIKRVQTSKLYKKIR